MCTVTLNGGGGSNYVYSIRLISTSIYSCVVIVLFT